MRAASAGSIVVAGKRCAAATRARRSAPASRTFPEDRLHTGVAPSLLDRLERRLKSYRGRTVDDGPAAAAAHDPRARRRLIERYDVRGGGPELPARRLSGGNLQKVVLAREFEGEPRVLVVASPTRGLDVARDRDGARLPARRRGARASACC